MSTYIKSYSSVSVNNLIIVKKNVFEKPTTCKVVVHERQRENGSRKREGAREQWKKKRTQQHNALYTRWYMAIQAMSMFISPTSAGPIPAGRSAKRNATATQKLSNTKRKRSRLQADRKKKKKVEKIDFKCQNAVNC